MKAKSFKKRKRSILILLVFVLVIILLCYFLPKIGLKDNLRSLTASLAFLSGPVINLPARLEIPKLSVNAKIESLGRTPKGEVDVPKGPSDVAWFNLGPRPGEDGNAIISGHYGPWKNGDESVFNDLSKLSRGDKLYIKDKKGITTTFIVNRLQIYNAKADVSAVFVSTDGKAHLNLITCEGAWDKVSKTYSDRLVIFADKE